MEPISLIYGLAQFVPQLLRWAGKDGAAEIADKAVKTAQVITGLERPEDAIDALKANPELVLRYQQTMNEVVVAQLDAETRQLESINATMRAEYASNDNYTRRWRPTMGYAVTIAWFLQMLAVSAVIVWKPLDAVPIITALAQLTALWGVALTILGVAVAKRSEDKQVAAGFQPTGIVQTVKRALTGK